MIANVISKYINVSYSDINYMLTMTGLEVHKHPVYGDIVREIDVEKLHSTMETARDVLDHELPDVVNFFMKEYKLEHFPLSGFMVVNWVMGYLQYPEHLPNLIKVHSRMPKEIMKEVIPEVLAIFSHLPEASDEWQKAFATLIIPLIAK